MEKKFLQNYFFLLFLIIPISIIIGPAISLINILLIDLSFIIFIFYTKKFDIFNHLVVRTLIILYVYLIFNSFIALDFSLSASRNFGFFRFIVFFVSINYFFYYFSKFNKILYFWLITISIVVFDAYLPHQAQPVSRECYELRTCVVFKTSVSSANRERLDFYKNAIEQGNYKIKFA